MPSKIRVLSEHTINKIAAGEVIENPASVVKELVENSIDAQATEICIEIQGGGRQLIRITDNGCGMNQDDALLCLERHATSKIREVDDIFSIGTMGFRGEAIPSIASISKFTLITSENGLEGTMIIIEGGKILQCSSAARSKGTTIEVKSLFFNVPVRRKFQRSPAYDANEILKVVTQLSLSYPEIAFEFINDQKRELKSHIASDRVRDILGADFAEHCCSIDETEGEFQIRGMIGLPHYTRHQRTGQYLFINHRAVVSSLVNFAVREGYGTSLTTGRHPVYVLHLTLPSSLVDVNVHPQKREVRLRQEQHLKEFISQAIRKAIGSNQVQIDPLPFQVFPEVAEKSSFTARSFIEFPIEAPMPIPVRQKEFSFPVEKRTPRVLATIKSFILIENETAAFSFVDQQAAYRQILFEKLQNQSQKLAVEHLLIPYSFETTPIEFAVLKEYLPALNEVGIGLRESGINRFIIDAVPQAFGKLDSQAFVLNLVQELSAYKNPHDFLKEREKQLAITAARHAGLSQKQLSIEEAQLLLRQLYQCQSQMRCPLGQMISVPVRYEEIQQQFHR